MTLKLLIGYTHTRDNIKIIQVLCKTIIYIQFYKINIWIPNLQISFLKIIYLKTCGLGIMWILLSHLPSHNCLLPTFQKKSKLLISYYNISTYKKTSEVPDNTWNVGAGQSLLLRCYFLPLYLTKRCLFSTILLFYLISTNICATSVTLIHWLLIIIMITLFTGKC